MSILNDTFTHDYTQIFGPAIHKYKKLTGQDLDTHAFASNLDNFNSTDAVLNVLRDQMHHFDEFRKGDNKLMTWLESIVDLLFMVSAKLGESTEAPSSPAKPVCTAIVVLFDTAKDVDESYDNLVNFFERIQFFLQRVNSLSETSYTASIRALLWEIMAEALSTLAVFTKMMKERGFKKIWKGLMRKAELEGVPQRLNTLTKEETLLTAAGSLEVTHHDGVGTTAPSELIRDTDDNVTTVQEIDRRRGSTIKALTIEPIKDLITRDAASTERRVGSLPTQYPLRDKLRSWLTPPDPSINHNAACKTRYDGTSRWLIQGKAFRLWKKNGPLLWVHGKPGSGKTVLCSAIIEDIKRTRDPKSDLIAYYYFDCNDPAKCDVEGLLASLVMQLSDGSIRCRKALSQLYINCGNGSEKPGEAALIQCLKRMLEHGRQHSIHIVIDALDDCPNATGTKSARNKVLMLVGDLVRSRHRKLCICITSSPEQDIKTTLNLLTSTTRRVTLHEETGQKDDIKVYIRSFVKKDQEMQKWTSEDQEFVIDTLTERAEGIFRWVSRRLDTLGGRIHPLILNAPEELGTALDETFGQRLQHIPEEKSQHALHLFQCLVAAIRPLQVNELAELLVHDFDPSLAPNEEEAVLSACPSLIAVVDGKDSKIVQFSSPMLKEFLTSDRLKTLYPKTISRYHISLEAAHTVLSRACIDVLLQLDETVDKTHLKSLPLVFYAAQHWVDHTQFGNVTFRNQDVMKYLFDSSKSHLEAWIWIHDIEKVQNRAIDDHPSPRSAPPLYYAALCGLSELTAYLANMHRDDLKDKRGYYGTPLHAASHKGHLTTAHALIEAGADVNAISGGKTPLHTAFYSGQLEAMRLLLKHGADVDAKDTLQNTLLHQASLDGQLQVIDLLLKYNADAKASNRKGWTPLHRAALCGQSEVARCLLAKGAEVNTRSRDNNTPLHIGSIAGKLKVVQLLLEHGAEVNIRGEHNWTPIEAARANGHHKIADLLSKSGDNRQFKLHKKEGTSMKRRALLVGITYSSPSNTWSPLDGPHGDVDRYQELLIVTYGYHPEDITVLKDIPEFPELSQPTRVNMIRELKALVSGAAPGDRFTFLYSGHTDQRVAENDFDEEDGMDEAIITSDEEVIIDDELKNILVPLPVGCSLVAVLDASHSGTMLDLPHYHCNCVYVPWQSKGKRRTMTMQNINGSSQRHTSLSYTDTRLVRRQAMDSANFTPGLPSVTTYTTEGQPSSDQLPNQLHFQPLGEGRPTEERDLFPGGQSYETERPTRPRERMLFSSQIRYSSPEPFFVCDGWCRYNEVLHPNVISLSACSDMQRAWDGPNGSLTTVLCNYLKNHNHPSYGDLMSHINFQLHDNARALHDYTRDQRKKALRGEGYGFDGELDDFQEPVLSSLVRLNMEDTLQL